MLNWLRSLYNKLWVRAVGFAILYWAAAEISRAVSFQGSSFPTLWFPSGLFVAVLLLNPVADWSAYLVAALPAQLIFGGLHQQPLLPGLMIYLSGALEAATGAWLVQRFDDHPGRFITPTQVMNLIVFAVLVSSALSATLTTTLIATLQSGMAFWATWQVTWISRGLGILAVAPLILAWVGGRPRLLNQENPEQLIELAILSTGLLVCALYIFFGPYSLTRQSYMMVPFLVWAALRFGPRGSTLSGLIVTLVSAWGIARQIDGFANSDITVAPNMIALGSFLVVTLVTCYILATVWESGKRTEKALRESEGRYRLLVENQGEGVAQVNAAEVFTFANPAAAQIFGVDQLTGRSLKEFTNPVQFKRILQQTNLRKAGEKSTYELEIIRPDGRRCSLLITATPQYDPTGQWNGTFAVFHDQTERKQAEIALRESRARYQALFDHSPIPIWEEDFSRIKRLLDNWRRQGVEDFYTFFTAEHPDQVDVCAQLIRVLDVNEAVLELFGYTDKAQFMAQVNQLARRGPDDIFIAELVAIAQGKTEFNMEGPNDLVDGVVRYHVVHWSVAPGFEQDYRRVILTITDVTERRQAEEQMRYLSTHDVLTGLYNRNFFEAELERLQNSRLEPVNLMMVDVNGMKITNDTLGHAAGDELLRRTAQVLRLSFRKEDIIARIGGDEFVILFHGSIGIDEAVNRVKACQLEHNHWYGAPALSLAIGAASGNQQSSLVELLKQADQSMYREKDRQRHEPAEDLPPAGSPDDSSAIKTGNPPPTG